MKERAIMAGIKYLRTKQMKGEKGINIKYNILELPDYLNPFSNMALEDQRTMFSLRCEMNPLKPNFKRNSRIKEEYCVQECMKKLDNYHITWRDKINKETEHRFTDILNGNLEEKIEILKQIKRNEKRREKL